MMMGSPFFAEIGNGEEYGNDQCREELEIGGGKPGPDDDGQDEVIGHGTQRGGKKPQGEVFALAEQGLADDDGGQAYDDGSAAHVDIGIALVLGQQRAGKTDEAIGDHQTENLHAVGGNALGPGHVLIIAGGTDGAAQLGAEEPVQQRHNGDDKDAADQNGGGHLGAGKQQLVLGAADGEIALAAHDVHIDGVEGQLGEDTGKDGRNAQYGMQKPGAKTGKRPGQHRAKQCQQGVHAADDAHGGNGAAGAKAVIYREVGVIQDLVGDGHADGHDAPYKPLCQGAGQGIEQRERIHGLTSSIVRICGDGGRLLELFRNGDAEFGSVLLIDDEGQVADIKEEDRGGGGIGTVDKDIVSLLACRAAQLIVADGVGGQEAAFAHAALAADNGLAGGSGDVAHGGDIGGDEVIGGLIEGIDLIAGGGHNGLDLIGIGDGVDLDGEALGLKGGLGFLGLDGGVFLAGIDDDADGLNLGAEGLHQIDLYGDGVHIGGAGNIGAGGFIAGYQAAGNIVGHAGAYNRDIGGRLARRLNGVGGVRHDQIDFGGNELVDDGGAVGLLALCVLDAELNLIAQLLGEEFLKAAGGFVQCGVFDQLDNADLEHLFIGIGRGGGFIAAGGEAGDHETGGSCR